jgi:hypothetical protein
MQEITERELLNKYMVQSSGTKVTSWSRFISFNDGSKEEFNGTLRWDENDGYWIEWYNGKPAMADRPEFEYIVDCITNEKRIPEYGDLSDAGMDGA